MDAPERRELRYEGKAKKVYATADPELLIVSYKDDATAFNARKRGTIRGKGEVNGAVSAALFELLEGAGVPTHFVALLGPGEQLVRAVEIIPLEVVVRNRAAGSFASRYGVEEGRELDPVVIEWCLKSDELGDPPLNDAAAVALGLATPEELALLFEMAVEINDLLAEFFAELDLELVDFKLEFGRLPGPPGAPAEATPSRSGEDPGSDIVLADEISPDTCRLWDRSSGERLDKDRFRRDLGRVEEAYQEVLRRVLGHPRAGGERGG